MKTAIEERPILFSGEMVRAILAGRKTQTRRVVKVAGVDFQGAGGRDGHEWNDPRYWGWEDDQGRWFMLNAGGNYCGDGHDEFQIPCPYGRVGTRLWVRETVCFLGRDHWWDADKPRDFIYTMKNPRRNGCAYRAETDGEGESIRKEYGYKWTPAIHMPRWASRLTLEISAVRVERLHEISEADAKAEGVEPGCLTCGANCVDRGGCGYCRPDYRDSFVNLWGRINAKPCKKCRGQGVITAWTGNGDGSGVQLDSDDCPLCKGNPPAGSWEANPWVWCISFKRLP